MPQFYGKQESLKKEEILMKHFNLQEKRPKVLLFGNGMTYSEDTEWDKIITKLSKDNAPQMPAEVPYSVLATIKTSLSDTERHNKYGEYFKTKYPYQEHLLLTELLKIPFDAVLTTNYTYEAEECFVKDFHEKKEETLKKYWLQAKKYQNKRTDPKYLLHTYNHMTDGQVEQDIWHIHGEVRRKSSMILTHDEYSHLISELVLYNKERGRDYYNYKEDVQFESWVDYLLLGDLYIIGFGFVFTEFDLWWLLTRRLKEETGSGRLVFFTPESEDQNDKAICSALQAMGATVEHCGVSENDENAHQTMYRKAIEIIREA